MIGLNSGNDCCRLFQNVLSCLVLKNVQIIRHTKLYFTSCWVYVQLGLSHGGNSRVRVLRNTVMKSVRTCEGRSKWRLEKIAHWRLCDLYCAKYYWD